MSSRGAVLGLTMAYLALWCSGAAQAMPADCSVGAIADQPLVLRIAGQPDRPLIAARLVDAGELTMTSDEGEEEVYRMVRLELRDRADADLFDPVDEVQTNFLLTMDGQLAGRTFRKPLADDDTPEYDAQEKLGGQVVFNTWSIQVPKPDAEYGDYAVDVNHVSYLASARVEFGQPRGDQLAGRIHLCVPGGQTTPFDAPPNSPVEVIGSFVAATKLAGN